MRELAFKLGKQVAFCLLCCIARNLLEHFKLTLLEGFDLLELLVSFLELFVYALVLFLDVVELSVERFFLLLDTAFLTLNFLASVGDFLLALVSEAVDFVLALKDILLLLSLGGLDSVGNDALSLFLGTADFLFGGILAHVDTDGDTYRNACQQSDNYKNYR